MAEVDEYGQRREAARPTADSAQRRVDLFGTKGVYSWAEDKSRQYALPERTDWGDFIEIQGFLLE